MSPVSSCVKKPHLHARTKYDKIPAESPATGEVGLVRDSVYGPGRDNWNVSLFKSFTFSEERGSRVELRLETFNLFNHTQFKDVSSSFSSSNFGSVTSTYDPRTIQLGAKLYF